MDVKNNANSKDVEVFSKVDSLALYTPNNNTLSEICFVKILNPKLAGSAYYFHTGFNVGAETLLGFTTGDYVYIEDETGVNSEKYIEVELTLPAKLIKLYNHPISSLNAKLVNHIKYWFKEHKRLAGCSLLFTVPARCYIKEKDLRFVQSDGALYNELAESLTDTTATVTDTENSEYNDGTGSDGANSNNNEDSNNSTLLIAAAAAVLAFLK